MGSIKSRRLIRRASYAIVSAVSQIIREWR
jgi:hypothetical protein